jgi:hypothetical protein
MSVLRRFQKRKRLYLSVNGSFAAYIEVDRNGRPRARSDDPSLQDLLERHVISDLSEQGVPLLGDTEEPDGSVAYGVKRFVQPSDDEFLDALRAYRIFFDASPTLRAAGIESLSSRVTEDGKPPSES